MAAPMPISTAAMPKAASHFIILTSKSLLILTLKQGFCASLQTISFSMSALHEYFIPRMLSVRSASLSVSLLISFTIFRSFRGGIAVLFTLLRMHSVILVLLYFNLCEITRAFLNFFISCSLIYFNIYSMLNASRLKQLANDAEEPFGICEEGELADGK